MAARAHPYHPHHHHHSPASRHAHPVVHHRRHPAHRQADESKTASHTKDFSEVLRRYRPQDFEGTSAFPDVPRFDGRDYELFHAEMVAYNNILKEKRRKNRSGNFEAWEMAMKRYDNALRTYNATMEARNRKTLVAMGGWKLPLSLAAPKPYVRRDLRGMFENRTAFVLDSLLSREACAALLQASERVGYRELVIRLAESDRNNTRSIVSDQTLANSLWSLVRREVRVLVAAARGDHVVDTGLLSQVPTTLRTSQGEWVPYGVNPRFRFCRYKAGQKFAAHRDDVYRNYDASLVSLLTFVVYLNDDFTGGPLNFLRHPWSSEASQADRDRDLAAGPKAGNIIAQVRPKPGLAAIFRHTNLHEGAPLTSGVKYIMRTDIVYIKRGVNPRCVKQYGAQPI